MTEEIQQENPSLTFDGFVRFLKKVTKTVPCQMCGTDSWTISTADGVLVNLVGQPFFDNQSIQLLSAFTACNNCGHSRFFVAQTIIEWLKNNPAEQSDG